MTHYAQYTSYSDLHELKAMLSEARAIAGNAKGYLTPGDLVWQMFQNMIFDPTSGVRMWRNDDGKLIGFCLVSHRKNNFETQIHPHWQGTIELEMVDWALSVVDPSKPIETSANEDDVALMAVFAKRGFVRDDWALYCNLCDLTQPIPNLPTDGFVVREVQPGEYEERVAAHRDVWHPSVVTFESYAQLRAQAGYEPNLDLVAVVPNMLIVSYCHGWMDYPNKIGEFEPVGTRKAHQRKGYGKAVLLEGLRRMKALGADTAMVYCLEHNLPFYGSVGFKPISKWLGFSK